RAGRARRARVGDPRQGISRRAGHSLRPAGRSTHSGERDAVHVDASRRAVGRAVRFRPRLRRSCVRASLVGFSASPLLWMGRVATRPFPIHPEGATAMRLHLMTAVLAIAGVCAFSDRASAQVYYGYPNPYYTYAYTFPPAAVYNYPYVPVTVGYTY